MAGKFSNADFAKAKNFFDKGKMTNKVLEVFSEDFLFNENVLLGFFLFLVVKLLYNYYKYYSVCLSLRNVNFLDAS